MISAIRTRLQSRRAFAALLGLAPVLSFTAPTAPAQAILVFDSANYAQNILTAAHTLQQINQQIQSLQNEASMLVNMGKNLARIDFGELAAIRTKMEEIDQLIGEAKSIGFNVDALETKLKSLYPRDFDALMTRDARVAGAQQRLDASMDAFHQTMTMQSKIVENVREDMQSLSAIVGRSQSAEGALAAQQATNQLLALATKQQILLQQMMAAQFRSESVEQARRIEEGQQARAATRKFLGSGSAYTPR